jgi:hypothetical protein
MFEFLIYLSLHMSLLYLRCYFNASSLFENHVTEKLLYHKSYTHHLAQLTNFAIPGE